jgi:hypothetical protein
MRALGRIPIKINGLVAPSVRNVSFPKATPQKTHKFADGSRARSEGQPEYKFSLTCSLLQEKQEILALIEAARQFGEVNISYELGVEEYLLVDCGIDTEDTSSDQDGTADLQISGIATDRLKVR